MIELYGTEEIESLCCVLSKQPTERDGMSDKFIYNLNINDQTGQLVTSPL
jgi:hypothetical protein